MSLRIIGLTLYAVSLFKGCHLWLITGWLAILLVEAFCASELERMDPWGDVRFEIENVKLGYVVLLRASGDPS